MSSGLIGDAEKIRFVWGQDTVEKAQRRYVLLKKAVGLSTEQKIEIVVALYGLSKNEIVTEMDNYVAENYPKYADAARIKKFNLWYQGIISKELADVNKYIQIVRRENNG